ncbi:uncharacterized protein LOC114422668 isoform X2 [Glycine soja]|uniref:Uncharacterized protein n=1 Tax=Glycine max TaxID=3847 RepID=I1KW94_SOYBN|nr:uncharacterized protein LOC100305840 isoform X1 [Glycine max]XP_028244945.1 uncharacterized protein LOC114422668 isoform X2 [Glycine soja]|eukprot:XP_014633804.1 uncharacterized protein LOC100305840 isoform X1 [Glycine max]
MHHICVCCKGLTPLPPPPPPLHQRRNTLVITFASKSGGGFSLNSLLKSCKSCGGKGAIECPGFILELGRGRERIKRTEIYLNGGNVLIAKDLG